MKIFKYLIIFSLLVPGFTEIPNPGEAYTDPLIVHDDIINVRKNFIRKLLASHKYREAVDELLELRTEVPRKTGLFVDLWIGYTYMQVADYLQRGLMVENEYNELIYKNEIDIVYYTDEEKDLLRKKVAANKDYFTSEELAKIDKSMTDVSASDLPNDVSGVLEDDEVKAAAEKLGAGGGDDDIYIPWDETPGNEKEIIEEKNVLSGTVGAPVEELVVTKKTIKKPAFRKGVIKYYELTIKHFNRVIQVSVNNPYRERAVIKKAETFYRMMEMNFSIAEYDFFIKAFPKSDQLVDVLIAKGNLYSEMKEYKTALKIFLEILDTYPKNERRNYIRLKIKYLKIMLGEAGDSLVKSKGEIEKKLKILEEFEKEIKLKEERLKEIESFTQ